MLPISLNPQSSNPFYQQIIEQMRNLVLSGRLEPGSPLPSVRGLAQELAVSVITTRRAYDELERAGMIYTRPGMGSFVAEHNHAQRNAARMEHVRNLIQQVFEEATRLGLKPTDVQSLMDEMRKQQE